MLADSTHCFLPGKHCSAKKSARMGRWRQARRTKKWRTKLLKRKYYVAKALD
jgi:hypothetical protein